MEISWITLDSLTTYETYKQHAYVPKISRGGNKRNITLCGKFRQIDEEGKSELFDNMEDETLNQQTACKTCLKIYNKINKLSI